MKGWRRSSRSRSAVRSRRAPGMPTGDLVAERIGVRPVGVPHMGGYAVGRRLVERYLERTGLKAAQVIVRPVSEIFEGARR
ncbi:MAG: hypothetical protein E6I53_07555 [Chloroflexi bacterium]|nr:MAG: hypothetical protein E6I53_07555 [Chloroflexota bacterium]